MSAIADLREVREWSGRSESFDECHAYCPRCSCNKGGLVGEPNPVTDACEDGRCLCHDEEAYDAARLEQLRDEENDRAYDRMVEDEMSRRDF